MIIPISNLEYVFSAFQRNEEPDSATIAQAEDELMQAEENPQEVHKLMQRVNQSLQNAETLDKAAWHLASRIKRSEAPRPKQPDYIPGLCVERTFISALKTLDRQISAETAERRLFRKNIKDLYAQVEAIKKNPAKLSPFPSLPPELIAFICVMANLKHTGIAKVIDPVIVQLIIDFIDTQRLDLVQDLGFTSLEQILGFFGDQFSNIKNLSINGLKKICNEAAALNEKKMACFTKFINSLKNLKSFEFISDLESFTSLLKIDLIEFSSHNPDLEELTIVSKFFEEVGNVEGLKRFSKIKSVKFIRLNKEEISKIWSAQNLNNIEKLTIDSLQDVHYSKLNKLIAQVKMSALINLNLYNFKEMPSNFFNTIATHSPNLKKIKLYNCVHLEFVGIILKEAAIEEIGCYDCTFGPYQLHYFILCCQSLNKLKKVEFIGCKDFHSTAAEYVKKNFQRKEVSLLCS
jgi:hypothetical protein